MRFADVLEKMGADIIWGPDSITVKGVKGGGRLQGIDVDCGEIPDAAMTLAAVTLVCDGQMVIRNVGSWRVKETERMKAIVCECRKLGCDVVEGEDFCKIRAPKEINDNVLIDTYDDHRMAMTFALVACAGKTVRIRDPGCTKKTFPQYFEFLERIAEFS